MHILLYCSYIENYNVCTKFGKHLRHIYHYISFNVLLTCLKPILNSFKVNQRVCLDYLSSTCFGAVQCSVTDVLPPEHLI